MRMRLWGVLSLGLCLNQLIRNLPVVAKYLQLEGDDLSTAINYIVNILPNPLPYDPVKSIMPVLYKLAPFLLVDN